MEETGPGDSAWTRTWDRSPRPGRKASRKTTTPMPPSQELKDRQNSRLFGSDSTSLRMVPPVVVKPETLSKRALTGENSFP